MKLSIHQPHTLGLELAKQAIFGMRSDPKWAEVGPFSFDGQHTLRFDLMIHGLIWDTPVKAKVTIQPDYVDFESENELTDVPGYLIQMGLSHKLAEVLK